MPVLTHFPLLKALGWALFNSLWQMAALWLLYSLLMAVFHSAAARIRYSLALLLLGAGTVWTAVTFLVTLLFPDTGNNTWLPFLSPAQYAPGWFWQTGHAFMDAMLSYGSTLYLLILTGLLVRYAGHYWYTRKLTRLGLSNMPPEFRVFVTSTALQLGIRKPVRTWLSSLIDVPLTLGFFKPVILIPMAMICQLTPAQVEAILIHELGHIQRKDYLLHLLVTLLEGLFFFNPFTRMLIRQLKKEREHCCDDLVLQFKYDPHAYVSALLSLASRHQQVQKLALAATGTNDRLLLERARRVLLQQKGNRSRPGTRSILPLLFTGLITALALYRPLLPLHRPTKTAAAISSTLPAFAPAAAAGTLALTTTAPLEFSFSRLLYSTPPPTAASASSATPESSASSAAPAAPRHQPRPRIHVSREPEFPGPNDNNFFATTADEATISGDGNLTPLVASADDMTDAANTANAAGKDTRDYSLNIPATIAGPQMTFQQGAPAVPNTSFSFQYTLGDSAQPEEQLIYLQLSAQQDVLNAIAKLQKQTATQLKALSDLQTKAGESVHLRRQILTQQRSIQLEYLRKISTWQRKLEKTTHIRLIVYI